MLEVFPRALFWNSLADEIKALKEKNLYRCLERHSPALANFSSNDYLGLSTNSGVCRKAAKAVRHLGAGSGASRLISGNLLIHEKLEKKIALFKREESSLVFSSGYMANLGVITSLAGENDVIFLDRLNHASLIDAAKLSRAKLWVYPHKDVGRLEVLLKRAAVFRRRLVITDAYFSMDGDVAPLDGLLDVCEKSDSILMIDEAHSTGVFGRTGRGMTEHFGLEARIPVVMGTLSKALGSSGGFVAGKNLLRETLINRAREFIYTTAPVPAASAAAMASLEWIEKNPAQLKKFWRLIQKTRDSLKGAGFDLMGSEGPVIPVVIKNSEKTLRIRDFLKKQGVFVPAIRPPTVPKNTDRLRISLKATHTDEQIDRLIQALVKARKKFL